MRVIIFVLSFLLVSFANADQLNGEFTVSQVFAEGASGAGFYPDPVPTGCAYHIMYINLANEGGRAMFSLAISAKAAGQKIVRIDFTKDATNTVCTAIGLHVK